MSSQGQDFKQEILDSLDFRSTYMSLGVKISGGSASKDGWLECYAFGRDEKNPSAAINIRTGYYKDFGGSEGKAISIFDFLVANQFCPDFKAALEFCADRAGVKRKRGKRGDDSPQKSIDSLELLNPLEKLKSAAVIGTIKNLLKGELSGRAVCDALKESGAWTGSWPKTAPDVYQQTVIAYPAYPNLSADGKPCGYVMRQKQGKELYRYRGKDQKPQKLKSINIGESGYLNRFGLKHFQNADVVFKVEGEQDMLSLQALIPPELWHRYVVITTASGANERSLIERTFRQWKDKDVVLIHDCDKAGQDGLEHWKWNLCKITKKLRVLTLPYPIEEKHGKDLKDWIEDGLTWEQFIQAVDDSRPFDWNCDPAKYKDSPTPEEADLPPAEFEREQDRKILDRTGAVALGYVGTKCYVYSKHRKDIWEIKTEREPTSMQAILKLGEPALENLAVFTPKGHAPDPNKIAMPRFLRAVATECGLRRYDESQNKGAGIWRINGKLLLVQAGESFLWDGERLERQDSPIVGDIVTDTTGAKWIDLDIVRPLLMRKDRRWIKDVWNDLVALFGRWDNWSDSWCAKIMAALVPCLYLQTQWKWRPMVSIVGQSNTGKSFLIENTLKPMFGELGLDCAKPSEAAIRQAVGNTARVLLIDEFEAGKHRDKVLETMRASSRGTTIRRGTADQKGVSYVLRHIPVFGGTETDMKNAADVNRYILQLLNPIPRERPGRLILPSEAELHDIGQRALAVAIKIAHEALALAERLERRSYGDKIDKRMVENYAAPVAVMNICEEVSGEDQFRMLEDVLTDRSEHTSEILTDAERVMESLKIARVRIQKDNEDRSVESVLAEYCRNHRDPSRACKVMKDMGIWVGSGKSGLKVIIHPTAASRNFLRGTNYESSDITQHLRNLPGAKYYGSNDNKKVVSVPVEAFFPNGVPEEGDDDWDSSGRFGGIDFDDDFDE